MLAQRQGRRVRRPLENILLKGRWTPVVLTCAHLDHNPSDSALHRLAALCQRCHMIHDGPEHRRRRWMNAHYRRAPGNCSTVLIHCAVPTGSRRHRSACSTITDRSTLLYDKAFGSWVLPKHDVIAVMAMPRPPAAMSGLRMSRRMAPLPRTLRHVAGESRGTVRRKRAADRGDPPAARRRHRSHGMTPAFLHVRATCQENAVFFTRRAPCANSSAEC